MNKYNKKNIVGLLIVIISIFVIYFCICCGNTLVRNIKIIHSLQPYHDEINKLLGKDSPKNYLIALMNTSEKKPDGGFFGSYAILTLYKTGYKIYLKDSYYPRTVKNIVVGMPDRVYPLVESTGYEFLGANKIGFTEMDGSVIASLYEKTFDQPLAGVIFIKDKMFEGIIDDFDEKFLGWEILNATADQRGLKHGQKSAYFSEIRQMMNKRNMIKYGFRLFWKFPKILDENNIRVYLPDVSTGLKQQLIKNNLILEYDPNMIYHFDYNFGMNKIDRFIDKKMILYRNNSLILQSDDDFISGITDSGNYSLITKYVGKIPDGTEEMMKRIADKYGVKLGSGERHILGLDPYRFHQGVVYLPKGASDIVISGSQISKIFETPFAKAVLYRDIRDKFPFELEVKVEFKL